MTTFEELEEARALTGMNIQKFCRAVGLDHSSYYKIKKGQLAINPSLGKHFKSIKLLNNFVKNFDYLLD